MIPHLGTPLFKQVIRTLVSIDLIDETKMNPQLLFFIGKGGVGKSTSFCADFGLSGIQTL